MRHDAFPASPLFLFQATLLCAALGCGSEATSELEPGEGSISRTIGAQGGELELRSGARLLIPRGALAEDTRITLEERDGSGFPGERDHELLESPVRVRPVDLRFAETAELQIPVRDGGLDRRDLRALRIEDPAATERRWRVIEGAEIRDAAESDVPAGARRVSFDIEGGGDFSAARALEVFEGDVKVAATIGRDGGRLRLANGTELTIPARALEKRTEIEMVERNPSDLVALRTSELLEAPIRISPRDLALSENAVLEIPVRRADLDERDLAVRRLESEDDQDWSAALKGSRVVTSEDGAEASRTLEADLGEFGILGGTRELEVFEGRQAVAANVGGDGAVLQLESGAWLRVPGTALRDDTELEVATLNADDLTPLPQGYEMVGDPVAYRPHGTRFDREVSIEVPVDVSPGAVPDSELRLARLDDEDDTEWSFVDTARFSEAGSVGRVARTEQKRFSVYAVARLGQAAGAGLDAGPDGANRDGDAGDGSVGRVACSASPGNDLSGAGPALTLPVELTLDCAADRAFVSDILDRAVFEIDLATGARTLISGTNTGTGTDFSLPTNVIFDGAGGRLLVADGSELVAVALPSGDRTPFSGAGRGTGTDLVSPGFALLDAAGSRVLGIDQTNVISIDLATGDRSTLDGGGVALALPRGMVLDAANDRLLVLDTTLEAIVAVDLSDGARSVVSDLSSGSGVPIDDASGLALDAAGGRVLVVDAALRAVVAIELSSGDRSILSDASRGSGRPLWYPHGIHWDADNGRALVTQSYAGLGGPGTLLAIDGASGDRIVLTEAAPFGSGPPLTDPRALALDLANGRALLADSTRDAVLEVDLASGDRRMLSSATRGTGPVPVSPVGLALDAANGRVLMTDTVLESVTSVDLVSGDRTVLSGCATVDCAGGNVAGSGPAFSHVSAVTLDAANDRIFVVEQVLRSVMTVDLSDGTRDILSGCDAANCAGVTAGLGTNFNAPRELAIDAANGRVLVADFGHPGLFTADLTSGDRTLFSVNPGIGDTLVRPMDVVMDIANSRALLLDAGTSDPSPNMKALYAIALDTGARTTLSGENRGSGIDLISPRNLELDAAGGRVLVLDSAQNALIAIDLTSGDRSIVSQ